MLFFEDIEPMLHRWAGHFSNNYFDHWELINAVWEKGDVMMLPDIKFASNRIKWDMMDYMRTLHNPRTRKRWEAKGKVFPSVVRFSDINEFDNDNDAEASEGLMGEYSVKDNGVKEVDEKDLIDLIINCRWLSRCQKLALRLYYQENMTLKEIGKVTGHSMAHISYQLSAAYKMLKSVLVEERLTGVG